MMRWMLISFSCAVGFIAFGLLFAAELQNGDEDSTERDHLVDLLNRANLHVLNNPKSAQAHSLRGDVLMMQGEVPKAIAEYSIAINIEASGSGAFFRRGKAWMELGEFDLALADFDEMVQPQGNRHTKGVQSLVNLSRGLAWKAKHEVDKALAAFDEAIRIDPARAMGYQYRGSFVDELGLRDRAIADFDQAISLADSDVLKSAKDSTAYSIRGKAFEGKGDLEKALADFNEMVRLEPKSPEGCKRQAIILRKSGQVEKALAGFARALRFYPKDPQANSEIAWIRSTSRDDAFRDAKLGVEFATKACELSHWKDDSCLVTLACASAESGQFDEAKKRLQQAMEMSPQSFNAQRLEMMSLFQKSQPYRDLSAVATAADQKCAYRPVWHFHCWSQFGEGGIGAGLKGAGPDRDPGAESELIDKLAWSPTMARIRSCCAQRQPHLGVSFRLRSIKNWILTVELEF